MRKAFWKVNISFLSAAVCSGFEYGFILFYPEAPASEIYTLSLHDALPISRGRGQGTASSSRGRSGPRPPCPRFPDGRSRPERDRKSTRLNSSHTVISYAVYCLKKKSKKCRTTDRHIITAANTQNMSSILAT